MMIKCEDYQLMQKCDEDMYNHYYVAKEPIPKNATTTFVMISLTPMKLQVEKKKWFGDWIICSYINVAFLIQSIYENRYLDN